MVPITGTGVRPFYEDVGRQREYELRCLLLKGKLGQLYTEYDPDLHDGIIESMVRAEMQVFHYEYLIANNLEPSPVYFKLLVDERKNLYFHRQDLETSLGKMRQVKREENAPPININLVNKRVYNLVTTLQKFAADLPEEKKAKLFKELEAIGAEQV